MSEDPLIRSGAQVYFRELDPRAGNEWIHLGQTASDIKLEGADMSNGRYRSAVTGKFVTLKYALRHPFTTVKEAFKKK